MEKETIRGKVLGKKGHAFEVAILMAVCDIVAVSVSYAAILWARYDFAYSSIPEEFIHALVQFLPIYAPVCLVVFWLFRLYRSMWRYASFTELVRILEATLITGVLHYFGIRYLFHAMPKSYYIGGMMVQAILVVGIRAVRRTPEAPDNAAKDEASAAETPSAPAGGEGGEP